MVIEDEAIAAWLAAWGEIRRPTLLLAAALACADLHYQQTAASLLELCMILEPADVNVRFLLAESYMALEKYEKAIAVLEQPSTLTDSVEAQSLLIYCYTGLSGE